MPAKKSIGGIETFWTRNSLREGIDSDRLRGEQLAVLVNSAAPIVIANAVNSLLLLFVFWDAARAEFLVGWLIVLWAASSVSIPDWRAASAKTRPERADPSAIRRRAGLTLARGTLWLIAFVALFPGAEPFEKVFLTFVCGGMTAGAIAALAAYPPAVIGYIPLLVGPLVVLFAASGERIQVVMAVMLVLYGLLMLYIARDRYVDFVNGVRMRAENLSLLKELESRVDQRTAALAESEQRAGAAHRRLTEATEAMEGGFALFDSDDRLVLCNSRYREFLHKIADRIRPGVTFREILEASVEAGQDELDGLDPSVWVERRMADHRAANRSFQQQLSGGRWLWVNEHRTPDGHIISTYTDITDLKSREAELRASREQLLLVTDSIPVMISYIDRDQRVRFANKLAQSWFQMSREEMLGKSLGEFLPPATYETIRPHVERALAGEPVVFESQTTYPDGIARYARRTYTPHFGPDGTVRGAFALVEDVTLQRETEGQLQRAQKQEAIGQLTGGIAHDFNNILCIILGNVELLMDGIADDKALDRMAQSALDATLRGAELTQRLLAFARKQSLKPRSTDVNRLVSETTELVRRTLEESIDVEVTLGGRVAPAMIDPGQLENAIVNLAINARDAMPDGGKLTIETANARLDEGDVAGQPDLFPGEYVMVAVTDTGIGMTGEVMEHAFEPFYTTKEIGKGSGLGLSMIYGFVKQSGGHITIQSAEGTGTTLRLYLPRAEVRSRAAGSTAEHRAPTPTGRETILVVEDDPAVRKIATSLIGSLGYTVLEAENGPAAMAILRDSPGVDLLFSDVVMPGGMSGVDLVREARNARPGLRALLASGYTENALIQQGRQEDLRLVVKPYRKHELARQLRAVLDGAGAGEAPSAPSESPERVTNEGLRR